MKTRALRQALTEARAQHAREIARIAELARDQLVPYFQKRGWSYVASNADWWIEDRRGRSVDQTKLPAAIREMLCLEVEHGKYLGFFIRAIKLEPPL